MKLRNTPKLAVNLIQMTYKLMVKLRGEAGEGGPPSWLKVPTTLCSFNDNQSWPECVCVCVGVRVYVLGSGDLRQSKDLGTKDLKLSGDLFCVPN